MPQTAKRGTYAVGRERRERILDAALQRFAKAGYTQTSLAEIARDVGITTPGLMHHFPTKQHLLLAIAERRFDITAEVARAAPDDRDGTGPLRMMLAISELFVGQPGWMELFVIVSAEAGDPYSPAHHLFVERYERVIKEVTTMFHDSVAAGYLRADVDYERLARESIALTDGLQLQWVLSGGRLDLLGMIRDYLEHLTPRILVNGQFVELSSQEDD
ncbi:TetR/AcrR family transcriptional regulator [Microbacterium sp.]|uniref:TetR/AcrR family transcriptional regulator n=1 Tax=Microbacterium sp. TaxID=51671 RepID=UPI0035B35310